MTLQETLDAFGYPPKRSIVVQTKSGAQYEVDRDPVEVCDETNDYVYGYRVNSIDRVGPIRRGHNQVNGTVRWFALKNIKLSTTE